MLFSIVCAFMSAVAFSADNCIHTTDRYAASPFGLDFIEIDLVIALLCGTVVSVLAIGLAAPGFKPARLCRLTDVRFFSSALCCFT
jgi:hypothetical protein